jgi:uncharacterized membrane protein
MSILGLLVSSTVLIVFYATNSQLPFCSMPTASTASNSLVVDCGKVLGSSYGSLFGIPLDVLACMYFMVNMALVCLVCFGNSKDYRNSFGALFVWRLAGIGMSAYLISVELFRLKAICVYCTTMHIAIIVDFIIVSYFAIYDRSMKDFISGKKVS